MPIRKLEQSQRVTVMGLGLFGGGVGAARFWAELGARVTVTDLRDAETLAPSLRELEGTGCRFVLGEHREEDFRNADVVMVNPAVRPDNRFLRLARNVGAAILPEVGLVFRIAKGPILAVTGSNGKSTTTALLGAMLRAHDPRTLVGGNLGGSLLPELARHEPSAPIVLELSSFQLYYLKKLVPEPAVAVVTNLAPNHLDWHRTTLHYYEAKRNLLHFQTPEKTAVLNAEDPVLREWAKALVARVIFTAPDDPGTENACYVASSGGEKTLRLRFGGEETDLAPLDALHLPGRHNVCNALQAAAAAYAFAKDTAAVTDGLKAFEGLPHRLETVATTGDVRFVNDSIATTPESAICALRAINPPVVLLAGGYDKGIPFDALAEEAVRRATAVVLIGQTAPALRKAIEAVDADAVRGAGGAAEPLIVETGGDDFEAAVRRAHALCPPGGTVLLSPACASYDMFRHFQERGERFAQIARAIAGEG